MNRQHKNELYENKQLLQEFLSIACGDASLSEAEKKIIYRQLVTKTANARFAEVHRQYREENTVRGKDKCSDSTFRGGLKANVKGNEAKALDKKD